MNSLPPTLPEEKIVEFFSKGERDKVIEHNLRLVAYFAHKIIKSTSMEYDDLFQTGVIGLIKAVDTFKGGVKFASYASVCIQNEMLMALRKAKKEFRVVSVEEFSGVIQSEYNLEEEIEEQETFQETALALSKLPPRTAKIIAYYYGAFGVEKLKQKEIAKRFSITQSCVSRIIKKGLKLMAEGLVK